MNHRLGDADQGGAAPGSLLVTPAARVAAPAPMTAASSTTGSGASK